MVTVKTGERPLPSLGQALSESLRGLQARLGGKTLASYFDGRGGKEVAISTVSRWISDPTRFPLVFGPVLAELDPTFRTRAIKALFASELSTPEVLSRISPAAATEYQRAVQAVVLEEIAPGKWGRG